MSDKVDDFFLKERGLWDRISRYDLEGIAGKTAFSTRLARANGWSFDYAKSALQEYKRFMYLICMSDKPLAPSDAVDQVWHMHLLYSQNYWEKFCPDVLERELHHIPSMGGLKEAEAHKKNYERTLDLYFKEFRMMPSIRFWPEYELMFSDDVQMARINLRDYWYFFRPKKWINRIIIFITALVFFVSCLVGFAPFVLLGFIIFFALFAGITVTLKSGLPDGHFSKEYSYLQSDKSSDGGCSGCGSGCGGD